MIKNVLLDLDDTLLDFGKAENAAIKKTLTALDLEPSEENAQLYSRINLGEWKRLERGEITRPQVLVGRFEKLFAALGVQRDGLTAFHIYEPALASGHYFVDGAEELLNALYGKYDMYLVSNGTAPVQDGRIKSAGIGKFFKRLFISEHVGFDKPDKRFFDAVFNSIAEYNKTAAQSATEKISDKKDLSAQSAAGTFYDKKDLSAQSAKSASSTKNKLSFSYEIQLETERDKDEIALIRAQSVVVGDSLTSDILGGINAGVKTVWYNPKHLSNPSEIHPNNQISALSDLPQLLETL